MLPSFQSNFLCNHRRHSGSAASRGLPLLFFFSLWLFCKANPWVCFFPYGRAPCAKDPRRVPLSFFFPPSCLCTQKREFVHGGLAGQLLRCLGCIMRACLDKVPWKSQFQKVKSMELLVSLARPEKELLASPSLPSSWWSGGSDRRWARQFCKSVSLTSAQGHQRHKLSGMSRSKPGSVRVTCWREVSRRPCCDACREAAALSSPIMSGMCNVSLPRSDPLSKLKAARMPG